MTYKCKISSKIEDIRYAEEYILNGICELTDNLDNEILFEVKVILNELFSNAIKHGNEFSNEKHVDISAGVRSDKYIFIIVEDEGEGFDYKYALGQEITELDHNDPEETGRGILIVKNLCDRVFFNDKGNRITVFKRIRNKSEQ